MFKKLSKFLSFNHSDRCLLLKAGLLLSIVSLGLKWLPFQTWRPILTRMTQPQTESQGKKQGSIYKVVWAVTLASPYIPGVKCLARAIAAQILLERRGYPTQLRIGVGRDKERQFIAHAWLEYRGRTVMGGLGNMGRYFSVLPLPETERFEPSRWYVFSE